MAKDGLGLHAKFHKKGNPRYNPGQLKLEWYPKRDQNVLLNMVKNDQLCVIALMKRTYILVLLKMVAMATSHSLLRKCYIIDANTFCSFTKQDLTVKQAYHVSLCLVL